MSKTPGEPEYDVFLSYATEDREWCEQLAERLRSAGVRVWFDAWRLQPGDHVDARLNEGLEKSRKLVAVWSKSYFREDKHWTLAESYSRLHHDQLATDRPIIPVLLEDCTVKPTLRGLLYLDFRRPDDFELRFRELVQALDLPWKSPEPQHESRLFEHELTRSERGRAARDRGKHFEEEVATLPSPRLRRHPGHPSARDPPSRRPRPPSTRSSASTRTPRSPTSRSSRTSRSSPTSARRELAAPRRTGRRSRRSTTCATWPSARCCWT